MQVCTLTDCECQIRRENSYIGLKYNITKQQLTVIVKIRHFVKIFHFEQCLLNSFLRQITEVMFDSPAFSVTWKTDFWESLPIKEVIPRPTQTLPKVSARIRGHGGRCGRASMV